MRVVELVGVRPLRTIDCREVGEESRRVVGAVEAYERLLRLFAQPLAILLDKQQLLQFKQKKMKELLFL